MRVYLIVLADKIGYHFVTKKLLKKIVEDGIKGNAPKGPDKVINHGIAHGTTNHRLKKEILEICSLEANDSLEHMI